MRRPLGALATLAVTSALLLSGCGGGDETASDPAPTSDRSSPSTSPTSPTSPAGSSSPSPGPGEAPTKSPPLTPPSQPDGAVDGVVVALEHATAAGGQVQTEAVPVAPGATDALLSGITDEGLRQAVEQQVRSAGEAGDRLGELYGAVVSVGCDVPPGVSLARSGDGWVITPQKVLDPLPNCFAPVTTVAVVAVPG